MGKKQQPKSTEGREDVPYRIRAALLGPLAALAALKATDATEIVNVAVRELLEREKLWPPGALRAGPEWSEELNRAVRELLEREGLWPPSTPPNEGKQPPGS